MAVLLMALQPRPAADPAPIAPEATGYEWSTWVLPDRPRTPAATPDPLPRLGSDHDAARAAKDRPGPQPLRGVATWYAAGGLIAAAGPALRRSLGKGWRGERVAVTSGGRTVVVTLSDWCACGPRNGRPTLLDLSDDAFRRLAPLSAGVLRVRVFSVRLPDTAR